MISGIQVTIDVIVHATEDVLKIFESFEILDVQKEDFTANEVHGHFENPITMLSAKIAKKQAQNFIDKLLELLPAKQVADMVGEIGERTADSKFHMRLDKQEMVRGRVTTSKKDVIKIKIHAPVYNKKNTVRIFTEVLQGRLIK